MNSVRSFVAVPLPSEVQTQIFAAAQELARDLRGVSWSRKVENLHVTIKFLGQVEEERLERLAAALARALGVLPCFRIELRRMGAFPSAHHASVLWAGVDDVERGLASVAAAVEAVTVQLGFPGEQRSFSAHVTIGRSRQRGGVDARAALDTFATRQLGQATVSEVHLYESRLGGEGSTYLLRSRAQLGNSPN